VRPLATWADGSGRLDVTIEAERVHDVPLGVRVLLDGREIAAGDMLPGASRLRIDKPVPGVRPWHPLGYGDQPLYGLVVELTSGDVLLDRWERRTGFRTATIDRGADAAGTRFIMQVNGESILAKGVNWIPGDILPSRMTRARYALRLREAVAAGVNLIRVWGGGIYEDRDFYELCDELGLMVWQDFPFACACYPEEEPLASEIVAEARENVTRLAVHPSLVTWNGNNENLWLYRASGWDSQPGGELSWGQGYYLHTLPSILAELDPSRPYQAGSPWSGSWEHEPNDPAHQTFHSWEVWNREGYLGYLDSTPRFVAEFGWQAPPAWRTLRDAISDDPMLPDSPGVLHHQKAEDGNGKLARGLAPHFPVPADVDAWHYLTQLNQVRAVRTGIAHWRSCWPHTGGTILWQLNDLWPVTSWAAIDGAGRHKPLYFELRDLYAPRSLTVQRRDGGLVVAVLNDSPVEWPGRLAVQRRTAAGDLRASWTVRVTAAARQVSIVELPAEVSALGDDELLVAELDDVRTLFCAVPDKDFPCPDAGLTVTAEPVPGGLDVRVQAGLLADGGQHLRVRRRREDVGHRRAVPADRDRRDRAQPDVAQPDGRGRALPATTARRGRAGAVAAVPRDERVVELVGSPAGRERVGEDLPADAGLLRQSGTDQPDLGLERAGQPGGRLVELLPRRQLRRCGHARRLVQELPVGRRLPADPVDRGREAHGDR
jgi:beta-mannosidase